MGAGVALDVGRGAEATVAVGGAAGVGETASPGVGKETGVPEAVRDGRGIETTVVLGVGEESEATVAVGGGVVIREPDSALHPARAISRPARAAVHRNPALGRHNPLVLTTLSEGRLPHTMKPSPKEAL